MLKDYYSLEISEVSQYNDPIEHTRYPQSL